MLILLMGIMITGYGGVCGQDSGGTSGGTSGGSSGGSSGGGSGGGSSGPWPVVGSVQVGVPVSSQSGSGSVNGAVFPGNTGYVDITSTCTNSSAYMRVWLQVNITGATIDHYDWKIWSWANSWPNGTLAYYDSVVNINPSYPYSYVVRTYGNNNKIRYESMADSGFALITGGARSVRETIEVTAWTADGKFANAFFTVYLWPKS
ncbi:MAG: hypothetical protein QME16_06250 [Planctomycetota bacterium]|nr:hypothetical protein [Planctomycetota bacterium]